MSAKINIGLTVGVLVIMLVSSAINVYYTKEAKDVANEVNRLILEGRQIGNVRGNTTLSAVSDVLEGIKNVENDILGNLTSHRIVTNQTSENINELIAKFNQTNEIERSKAVQEIISAVNNNTALLEQLINQQQASFDSSGSIAGMSNSGL